MVKIDTNEPEDVDPDSNGSLSDIPGVIFIGSTLVALLASISDTNLDGRAGDNHLDEVAGALRGSDMEFDFQHPLQMDRYAPTKFTSLPNSDKIQK